jgi:hypothetical protein
MRDDCTSHCQGRPFCFIHCVAQLDTDLCNDYHVIRGMLSMPWGICFVLSLPFTNNYQGVKAAWQGNEQTAFCHCPKGCTKDLACSDKGHAQPNRRAAEIETAVKRFKRFKRFKCSFGFWHCATKMETTGPNYTTLETARSRKNFHHRRISCLSLAIGGTQHVGREGKTIQGVRQVIQHESIEDTIQKGNPSNNELSNVGMGSANIDLQ